jgi:hypothetical protein
VLPLLHVVCWNLTAIEQQQKKIENPVTEKHKIERKQNPLHLFLKRSPLQREKE